MSEERSNIMDSLIAQDADLIDIEPVAYRYGFDGYGWQYIDNGSGSDWTTRHPDAEPLYAHSPADRIEALKAENARLREALTMIAHHIRDESDPYEEDYWGCRSIARAALAGDSHDQ